ncbi:MAG: glycosyltransferase family 39 protein [Methylacidiphilales bacterium]|nr:glycosyltransferase family 39 protein [Candidatus Methylacidiphilales bacterium]
MNLLRKIDLLSVLAVLIVFVVLFAGLGQLPFRDPDEGRNAEVAREMNLSGAWLVPTFNGLAYLDKPAFFFKAVALSYSLFGVSEGSARFPSAFFAALLLGIFYVFCRREYPEKNTAALAVIIAATSPLFIALGRHVIFDMTLAFFVSAAIFCGYLAEGASGAARTRWYLLGAMSAGFATLVKGPIGFLLPFLVLAAFNLTEGRAGWARRFFSPWCLLAFLAVVLPWFVGLSLQRSDFPYYGLVEESFHRFTDTSTFQRGGPFYYYGLVLLGGLFAWSLLLPEAVARTWRNRFKLSPTDRLFIVWSVVIVLFFTISKSKLPAYILTVSISLAALTARLFGAALRNQNGEAARIVFRGLLFLIVLSVAGALFLFAELFNPGAYTRWGIHGTEFNRLSLVFVPAGGVFLFIALVAALALWRRDVRMVFAIFLLVPVLLPTAGFGGILRYSEASSSRQLALNMIPLLANAPVVCFESFPCGLPYYLKQNVTLVSQDGSEFTSNYVTFTLKKTRPWPDCVIPQADWGHWLATRDKAFFLLTNNNHRDVLDALAQERNAQVTQLAPGWWGALIQPGTN